jgi:hypothetical protein
MSNYLEELNEAEPSITITPTPLIMEKVGESFRGLYVGMQSFQKTNAQTGELQTLPVAHFYDGNGIRFNMGAQLTRAMSMLKPGISVEIKLVELKANNKGGKTKIYSVTPLKIGAVNLEEMFGGVLSINAPAPEHLLNAAPIIENDEADELTAAGITRKTAQTYAQSSLKCNLNEFGAIAPQWVADHPRYGTKQDATVLDRFHFLKAAGAEGYQYITDENMIEVFEAVGKRHAE